MYGDLFKDGVIDAAKVTRSALQNAASIAALFLTTEAVIVDKPEDKAPGHARRGHGGLLVDAPRPRRPASEGPGASLVRGGPGPVGRVRLTPS